MQNQPANSQAPSQEGHIADLLSAYMDNRLTPVERLQVGAHLPECSSCRAQLASLQATVALLHELPVVPAPRPFYVYPDAKSETRPVSFLRRLFAPGWAYGYLRLATTVTALLLVAVVSLDALSLSTPRSAAPAPAASRGFVQALATPPPGTDLDSSGATPLPSVPTEEPKLAAPLTAPSVPATVPTTVSTDVPTVGSPAPALALPPPAGPTIPPAPPAASITPGVNAPPGPSAAPSLAMPSPPPSGAGAPVTGEASPPLTTQPTPSQATGKGLLPSPAATATLMPQPAPVSPTQPPVAPESRPTQAPPGPTTGANSVAPFVAPAAPLPAEQTAPAGSGAFPGPAGAGPASTESPEASVLRISEIGLGVLVIVLLALTLFARRDRKPADRG